MLPLGVRGTSLGKGPCGLPLAQGACASLYHIPFFLYGSAREYAADDFSTSVTWVKRKSYRDERIEWAWNGWLSHWEERKGCVEAWQRVGTTSDNGWLVSICPPITSQRDRDRSSRHSPCMAGKRPPKSPYPLPQVHCPGWPLDGHEAYMRLPRGHTVPPPSPSCLHPQRPTSLPLDHVIDFKYVLIIIDLRNPLRDSLGQVYQTHWTRSSQPPTGCHHQ